MTDIPFRLKADDSPSPDPLATGIELMAQLRAMADDALDLRRILTSGDPLATQRRAQSRAIELAETAATALETGEQLMQAVRAARLFSASYSDTGVRDGR